MQEYQQLWKANASNGLLATSGKKATGFNWLEMSPSRIGINNWQTTWRIKRMSTRRRATLWSYICYMSAFHSLVSNNQRLDNKMAFEQPSNRPRLMRDTNKGKLTPCGTTAMVFETRSWSRTEINSFFVSSVIFNERSSWGAVLKCNMLSTTPLFNIKALSLKWQQQWTWRVTTVWAQQYKRSVCTSE